MSALTLNIPGLLRAAPSSGPSAREERAASGQSGDDFSALFDQCGSEPPLAAAGAGDGVAKEGAAKQETAKPDAVTADKDAIAFGFAASLSGGEGDLVANLLCLAAPAATPGGTARATASSPSASKGDDTARLPDWSGLNMAAGDASGAQRPPGDATEAATERRIVTDTGAPRSEAHRIASALSFPILKGIESARAAAAAAAVDGPPSGRDDEAKTTRPETAAKDEPQPAQAVAPAVPAPLDAGTQAVSAASFAVAATAVPMAVAPETRRDGAARDQSSRAVPGAAATTQAALAPARARDSADPALSLSTAREDVTTRISVTSQRTWLEPVRPDFVATPQQAEARSGAEAPAATEAAQTVAQPGEELAPGDTAALMPQSRAENNFAVPASGEGRPVDKTTAAADPAPAPRAATLRRDLDVTLEPRDLGGLALRLKSVGDRLEIAFVADKGDTAQLIGDGSATLASQLRVAGLGLGGVAISVETKPDVAANPAADHAASAGGDPGAGQGSSQGSSGQDVAPRRQHNFGDGGQEHRDESTGDGDNARARRGDRGFYL